MKELETIILVALIHRSELSLCNDSLTGRTQAKETDLLGLRRMGRVRYRDVKEIR